MSIETKATLTEQELFAVFLNLHIQHWTNFGTIAADYKPSEFLREGGEYGELEDATEMLAENLANDEKPEDALRALIDGLGAYIEQLKTVRRDFYGFKAKHAVEPDLEEPDETTDPEGWKAWSDAWDEHEANPRFRVPALKEGEAA